LVGGGGGGGVTSARAGKRGLRLAGRHMTSRDSSSSPEPDAPSLRWVPCPQVQLPRAVHAQRGGAVRGCGALQGASRQGRCKGQAGRGAGTRPSGCTPSTAKHRLQRETTQDRTPHNAAPSNRRACDVSENRVASMNVHGAPCCSRQVQYSSSGAAASHSDAQPTARPQHRGPKH